MRWAGQEISREAPRDSAALPGLDRLHNLVRSVRTPEFAGITFHEVLAKSALNRVPSAAALPFNWTVNPYRGCSHGCVYCFARNTHTYLDLDAGADFDRQIVVKINIGDVLARELRRPTWTHEPVALGTNTDPYQRAEGRYRLMPGIIAALAGSGTPFSILTKGTTARRDLPLLAVASRAVPVSMGVSIALIDEQIHAALEPGTPTPRARLELVRAIVQAGLPCQVMVAPILPMITDSDEQIDAPARTDCRRGSNRRNSVRAAPAPGRSGMVLALPRQAPPEARRPIRRALPEGFLRHPLVRRRPGSQIIGAATQTRSRPKGQRAANTRHPYGTNPATPCPERAQPLLKPPAGDGS